MSEEKPKLTEFEKFVNATDTPPFTSVDEILETAERHREMFAKYLRGQPVPGDGPTTIEAL